MTGFRREQRSGLVLWRGEPCQAVHDYLLAELQPFSDSFIADAAELTDQIRGNLGEFITLRVGLAHDHNPLELFTPANAFQPLNRNSRAGLDLLWVHFGVSDVEDFALLQEVKLTLDAGLGYAAALANDYAKLFGPNPGLTLRTRLEAAKNELEFVKGMAEYVPRLSTMCGTSPQTSHKIRLTPTVVHDEGAPEAEARLQAVRATIVGAGWQDNHVEIWSVALDELGARLVRLAMGNP